MLNFNYTKPLASHFFKNLFEKGQLFIHSITCIQRPLQVINKSILLQQVVFKCWFYFVDLGRDVVSDLWSLKSGGCLIQVVSNTGLTVTQKNNSNLSL